MKQTMLKMLTLVTVGSMLCGCDGFFDKDNTPKPTPLTHFTPELKTQLVWNHSVNFGVGSNDYLKMGPAVGDTAVFTADPHGAVTASDQSRGYTIWRKLINDSLSAGPAAHDGMVFVGSRKGILYALRQSDGTPIWQTQLSSEVLSPPAAGDDTVLVKTTDGELTALNEHNGHIMWRFQQTEPGLILRGGSVPQIIHDDAVVGFANGNLAKLTMDEGSLLWQQAIALPTGSFAIQRMVDIDADPMIYNNRVYAATYQGHIASLDLRTGKVLWTHDISSFTGLTVDSQHVYVSDATSNVWAFDLESGAVNWRQNQLVARKITGPALIGNYLIVADAEGFLHWLNKQDGHFVARNRVTGFGVLATPVVSNNVAYLFTKDGHLAAYTFA